MSKILIGLILGAVLGAIDGLSALVSAGDDPVVREGIAGIVIGSTAKGILAGVLMGWLARRIRSVAAGLVVGALVGAVLAAIVCVLQIQGGQPPYWVEIMLPGTLVGLIVGFATQKYGRPAPQPAA